MSGTGCGFIYPRGQGVYKGETAFIPLLGETIRSLPEARRDRLVSLMVYHLYSGYDLSQPFMPQYQAHAKRLLYAIETLP